MPKTPQLSSKMKVQSQGLLALRPAPYTTFTWLCGAQDSALSSYFKALISEQSMITKTRGLHAGVTVYCVPLCTFHIQYARLWLRWGRQHCTPLCRQLRFGGVMTYLPEITQLTSGRLESQTQVFSLQTESVISLVTGFLSWRE